MAGAQWLRSITQETTVYSVRVSLRAALLSAGYAAEDVERVVDHLLD